MFFDLFFFTSFPNVIFERGNTSFPNVTSKRGDTGT